MDFAETAIVLLNISEIDLLERSDIELDCSLCGLIALNNSDFATQDFFTHLYVF